MQTLVEVTDPVNYAPYWSSVRGPWPGHTPVPVLATSGTEDIMTPYQTSVALAAAARLPAVSDQVVGDEALLLREAYTELARLPECKERSEEMHRWLTESAADAQKLEDALRAAKQTGKADEKAIQAAFAACTNRCAQCHRKYRDDVPKK